MEAKEVVANLQICEYKLKEAKVVTLKLQERLIVVQEIINVVESQYTYVLESLENSKEKVGNLQTWLAKLTHENQQLQSQVFFFFFSPYVYPTITSIFYNNNNVYFFLVSWLSCCIICFY